MLQRTYPKPTLSASEVFDAISVDIWAGPIAEMLEDSEIVRLRAVSTYFRTIASSDDIWLNRLTLLSLRHPILADVEQGAGESAYSWYARCYAAATDGDVLARRHRDGDFPYLKLYGVVDGTSFTPYAELRFPIRQGFIAELITLKARAACRDPPLDALLCFPGAPTSSDAAFRLIAKKVHAARDSSRADDLRKLPDELAKLFAPKPRADAASVAAPAPALVPQRRTLDVLQKRLGRKCVLPVCVSSLSV